VTSTQAAGDPVMLAYRSNGGRGATSERGAICLHFAVTYLAEAIGQGHVTPWSSIVKEVKLERGGAGQTRQPMV